MKALTVQQPWAWAIVHGGKDVENRTQAWSYRGPLAIHAGARVSDRGMESPLIRPAGATGEPHVERADGEVRAWWWVEGEHGRSRWGARLPLGAIIGVVDLVDVHPAHAAGFWPEQPACCDSRWAETSYEEHGGRTRRELVHLELANPRPLAEPIPCRGALGLWTPPADVLAAVADQLQAVTR